MSLMTWRQRWRNDTALSVSRDAVIGFIHTHHRLRIRSLRRRRRARHGCCRRGATSRRGPLGRWRSDARAGRPLAHPNRRARVRRRGV
jgi:hypothetical protein